MNQNFSIVDSIPWALHGNPEPKKVLRDSIEWETLGYRSLKRNRPYFSLITPMWNTPVRFLGDLIESCQAQSFPFWELILVDDGSQNKIHVSFALDKAKDDPRICVFDESTNRGIGGARNFAIQKASGEYLAMLDHDDLIHPRILAHYFEISIKNRPTLIYCNESKIDQDGRKLSQFFFKPDLDRDTLLRTNYIAHLAAVHRTAVEFIQARDGHAFQPGFDGVEDHDYFLRLLSVPGFHSIHTPVFGYLWRKSANSTAESLDAKPYVKERLGKLITQHAGCPGTVRFPESKGERYPGFYPDSQAVMPKNLLIFIWGATSASLFEPIKKELELSENSIRTTVTEPSDIRIETMESSPSIGQTQTVLVLDGQLKGVTKEFIQRSFALLESLKGYSSLSVRIVTAHFEDIGDLAYEIEGDGGFILRSRLTDADFPCDQHQGAFPMPHFLIIKEIPTELLDQGLDAILKFVRSRNALPDSHKHFYDGRSRLDTDHTGLFPEKIHWIYDDEWNRKLKDHWMNTGAAYDLNERWLHASKLESDWYEVPQRYRLADKVNESLKSMTAPLHKIIKTYLK